ncbi:MAG: rhomboid family intramembrane serine protease, partial [Crocinitomicaceae bacterium]|nr:rhomboid family intramembrane serine protease [Crocinitomicaceae bacterium]
IFYFASAMGSFLLYNAVGYNEMLNLINELNTNNISVAELNAIIINNNDEAFNELIIQNQSNTQLIKDYAALSFVPMVGASGAIFGVMAAFTILFPNTEFYLYFAIPVKAKYLVGVYFVYEVYMSVAAPNDGTAHLAHVGGAIVGAIIVLIWRRTDRQNFY